MKTVILVVTSFVVGFILCLLITPKPQPTTMNYFLQGFGVFLGVLAGLAIMLFTQWVSRRLSEHKMLKNLEFEFGLDIKKLDSWLEEIIKWRNAVNSNTLHKYHGYFKLSDFVTVTANNMFFSGLLYKYMSYDDIEKLQVIFSEISQAWEPLLNNEIRADAKNFIKETAVEHVDFWENKFRKYRSDLIHIKDKIK